MSKFVLPPAIRSVQDLLTILMDPEVFGARLKQMNDLQAAIDEKLEIVKTTKDANRLLAQAKSDHIVAKETRRHAEEEYREKKHEIDTLFASHRCECDKLTAERKKVDERIEKVNEFERYLHEKEEKFTADVAAFSERMQREVDALKHREDAIVADEKAWSSKLSQMKALLN